MLLNFKIETPTIHTITLKRSDIHPYFITDFTRGYRMSRNTFHPVPTAHNADCNCGHYITRPTAETVFSITLLCWSVSV